MSKVCQITGKKAQIGCNVSHSKHQLLDSVEDQRRWPSHD